MAGKFIVLDGPDGCGKSTQTKLLADYLTAQGVEVLTMRDPGSTAIGEKIRHILLSPEHEAMSLRTEVLLYMAARTQLWSETLAPALYEGKCVVLDRWLSSTCAYQGYAGGFGIDNIIRLAHCSLERVWPDMTIILDTELTTSSKRLKAQLDRMEQKGADYHKKVRDGFLEVASLHHHFVVVNATPDIQTVHKHIVDIVQQSEFEPGTTRVKS
ncbi:MAG: dTMP kinase [Sideroxyarcus sp.]|nr:dTMP kinase [Sideroxyarcus sp.]